MPQIKKPKVTKKAKVAKTKPKKLKKPITQALVKAKPTKNPQAYFECMCNQTQKGIKPKKISQVAHECKTNALSINAKMSAQKVKAVQKIKEGYEELGKGLSELIKASK